jgi:hypothetical protein
MNNCLGLERADSFRVAFRQGQVAQNDFATWIDRCSAICDARRLQDESEAVTSLKQSLRNSRPDKARGPGNQYSLRLHE